MIIKMKSSKIFLALLLAGFSFTSCVAQTTKKHSSIPAPPKVYNAPDCPNGTALSYEGTSCKLQVRLTFDANWNLAGVDPKLVTVRRDYTDGVHPDPNTLLFGLTQFKVTKGQKKEISIPVQIEGGNGLNAWLHSCTVTGDATVTAAQVIPAIGKDGKATVSSVTATSFGPQPSSPQQGGISYQGNLVQSYINITFNGGSHGTASCKNFGFHAGVH